MSGKKLWITFLIWPFLAFVLAWRSIAHKSSQKVVLAFYVLFGLFYVISPTMDGARRAERLADAHQEPFSNLAFYINNFLASTSDIFDTVIIYVVSRFTGFHGALFAVYALIFGWLSIAYLRLVFRQLNFQNLNSNVLLFLWLLVWVNSIFEIGGFRMWSAGWIFSLGALHYLIKPSYKALVLAALAILMHFSYLPLVVLLILYHFAGNRINLYAVLALITLFISELDIEALRQYSAYLAPAYEEKVKAYTGYAYIETKTSTKEQSAWFMIVAPKGLYYFTVISLGLIFYKRKKLWPNDLFLEKLVSISFILLSFSNLASLLPSGGRYRVLFYIFTFTTLTVFFNKYAKSAKFSSLNLVGLGFAALYILIKFRIGAETFNAMLLTPSFLIPLGFIEEISLKDLLF